MADGVRVENFTAALGRGRQGNSPGWFQEHWNSENVGAGQARISRHRHQAPSGLGLRGTSSTCPATQSQQVEPADSTLTVHPSVFSECRVMSGLVRQVEQSGRRIEVKVG